MKWLDGIINTMDVSLSKLRDSEGQGSLVYCSPWGRKELDTTERLNNEDKKVTESLSSDSWKEKTPPVSVSPPTTAPFHPAPLWSPQTPPLILLPRNSDTRLKPKEDLSSLLGFINKFSSVIQSCPTLCDPMDCSILGPPVHHQVPEFTQTHVH